MVMTRPQHANTTRLVCPKTHSLCAYLIAEAINDTLCFVSVYLARLPFVLVKCDQ